MPQTQPAGAAAAHASALVVHFSMPRLLPSTREVLLVGAHRVSNQRESLAPVHASVLAGAGLGAGRAGGGGGGAAGLGNSGTGLP